MRPAVGRLGQAEGAHQAEDLGEARLQDAGEVEEPVAQRPPGSMAAIRRRTGAGQKAACTASRSSASLVGKARKIVPSATPASGAISLVVGARAVEGRGARTPPTRASRRSLRAHRAARCPVRWPSTRVDTPPIMNE